LLSFIHYLPLVMNGGEFSALLFAVSFDQPPKSFVKPAFFRSGDLPLPQNFVNSFHKELCSSMHRWSQSPRFQFRGWFVLVFINWSPRSPGATSCAEVFRVFLVFISLIPNRLLRVRLAAPVGISRFVNFSRTLVVLVFLPLGSPNCLTSRCGSLPLSLSFSFSRRHARCRLLPHVPRHIVM